MAAATDDVTLRPPRAADAEGIAILVTALGYETDAREMADRLAAIQGDPDFRTVVAEVDGQVVGVAGGRVGPIYEKSGPAGQLMLLAVAETAQGRGIGRRLAADIETWVASCGGIEMVVHSGDQRPAAHRFYERLGYAGTGRRFIKPLTSTR